VETASSTFESKHRLRVDIQRTPKMRVGREECSFLLPESHSGCRDVSGINHLSVMLLSSESGRELETWVV
jgi:hypothetical protein